MVDVSEFDKDQLAEYALTTFNVELDMRKGIEKLRGDVIKLQQKPKDKPVPQPPAQATHILNRDTGMVFPYTELLWKHLSNRAYCDEAGNEV